MQQRAMHIRCLLTSHAMCTLLFPAIEDMMMGSRCYAGRSWRSTQKRSMRSSASLQERWPLPSPPYAPTPSSHWKVIKWSDGAPNQVLFTYILVQGSDLAMIAVQIYKAIAIP